MTHNPPVVWRHHRQLHKSLGKKGKIIVWTKVFVAPEGFEHEAPYISAIIELNDKKRMALQVVDIDEQDIKDGQEVVIITRRIGKATPDGLIEYGLKAKPV